MRSILSKILGLLFALNLALWLFVFISDDFVPNQVENKRDTLNLSASLYAQIALPILLNEDLNDFKKSVELIAYLPTIRSQITNGSTYIVIKRREILMSGSGILKVVKQHHQANRNNRITAHGGLRSRREDS